MTPNVIGSTFQWNQPVTQNIFQKEMNKNRIKQNPNERRKKLATPQIAT